MKVFAAMRFFLIVLAPLTTYAAEEFLGQITMEDFFLEPGFRAEEPKRGAFTLGRSYLAARWQQDPVFSGRLAVGTDELLGKTWFTQTNWTTAEKRRLGIIEAYGEADTGFGRVRLGLVPILFGYEGGHPEYRTPLFPSLLYSKRWLPKRDVGFSYSITSADFTSYFAVHNGESGEDADNRLWLTGRWVWQGAARSEYGFSGSVGRYFDPANQLETRMRIGNIFAGIDIYRLTVSIEATAAASHRDGNLLREMVHWHLDLSHPLDGLLGVLFRYDSMDPDHSVKGDQIREITCGFSLISRYKTSSLFITGTKVLEEQNENEINNDYLMINWRLTPWLVN